MLWRAEPIFAGRTIVCAAGGPSLSLSQVREIGIARAKDLIRVIAVNDAVYPLWYADLLYACDRAWWETHDGVPGFDGRRVTLKHSAADPYPDADWLIATGTEGFEPDPSGLRTAGNSGYQAMNLCAHLGANRIILVGFDMSGTHWFGEHPDGCRKYPAPNMTRRANHFFGLVEPLRERGIEVVNCSPGSALEAFPRGDLVTELKRVETAVKPKPAPADKKPVYIHRQALAGVAGYKTR